MGGVFFWLCQAASSQTPEDYGLRARGDPGARKFQCCNKDILTQLKTWLSSQGLEESELQRLALPARTSRTCFHEHQWAAFDQVGIVDALATSRTAAHMISRFRDIEKNVEANLSHEQGGLFTEITSESAQAFEAQRHSLVQAAEMMRRDAHSADVLSQLRSELAFYHLHVDGQARLETAFGTIKNSRHTVGESI